MLIDVYIEGAVVEILGKDRTDLIAKNALQALIMNLRAEVQLAVSGAMRPPMSLRPEVSIRTEVRAT